MSRRIVALALTLACSAVAAQEETGGGHPPAPAMTPRPALNAPKAMHARMLDITLAGQRLVALGEQGVILTSDDGQHWQQAQVPVNVMLTRLHFSDAQHGWALGYSGSVMQTQDGGRNWSLRHYDPDGHAIYDLVFTDAQHGIAVGSFGTVLQSDDGGASWHPGAPALADQRLHLNAILKLGDGSLLVTGEHGLLARSTDNGANWTALHSPYVGSFFGAVAQGDKGALVYGMRGHVYEAVDVGACPAVPIAQWDPEAEKGADSAEAVRQLGWTQIDNPSSESLFGTLALTEGRLFFGINGTVLKQAAPGAALTALKTPAVETLVHGIGYNGRLIAVGRQGIQDLGALP